MIDVGRGFSGVGAALALAAAAAFAGSASGGAPPGLKRPVHPRTGDPTVARVPTWPPRGRPLRLPVTRDAWVSSYRGETKGNLGGASRLKAKGCQEYTLFDVDASPLAGKIVTGALWHFHSATPDAPFLRTTVSTVATPWVEGTSSGYRPQQGSVCYEQAALGARDWAYPGSTLLDAAWGRGHTLWRFAECSPPDAGGWQTCAVEPAVVAARVAGLSHGFAVFDDVGSEWSVTAGEFKHRLFPNRFVHSREDKRFAPWLEVWVDGQDREPPEPARGFRVETAGLPAGEALVIWKTPHDEGGSGALGFEVTYRPGRAGGERREVPRYLIPMAGRAGDEVAMHIQDLGLGSGERVALAVRAVDGAGNVGEAVEHVFKVSATPRAFEIAPSGVEPFAPSEALPTVGGLRVSVTDLLDKTQALTGATVPAHAAGYGGGNHLWSARQGLVRLHSARNEAVCFQLDLEGRTERAQVDFRFARGAGLAAKLFKFDYVKTKAGPMPDALVPLGGAFAIPDPDDPEAEGARRASVMCEVYVPHATEPGRKRGALAVTVGNETLEIAVDLTVWDFALPDKLSFIPEMNCYGTAGPTGEGLAYYRLAHEHRCVLNRLYYNWRGEPSHAPKRIEGGFDWSKWDREFAPLFDGSAFADLPRKGQPVDVFYLPVNENWPVDIYANYRKSYWVEEAMLPRYKAALGAAFAEFARHFDRRGWHDTIFQFYLNGKVYYKKGADFKRCSSPWIFDEPVATQDFWALRWYGAVFHQAVDPVRGAAKLWYRCDVSRTEFEREMLWGVQDIEVMGGANPQKVRMKRDEKALWGETYFTEYGSANDPADSNTQALAWSLAAWADGADGVLPWQTIGSEGSWSKGEKTCLFYPRPAHRAGPTSGADAPGAGGPVPSVRLKAFRAGQQLVEYLTMLGDAYEQPRFAIIGGVRKLVDLRSNVVKTHADDAGTIRFGSADPAALWELRMRVGRMLDAKRPPYKRCVKPMPSPPTDMTRLPDVGYVSVGPIAPRPARDDDEPFMPWARGASSTGTKWTSIFNGRDLTGWRKAGDGSVVEGALRSRGGADLYRPGQWDEFALSFEIRSSGNAGLNVGQWGMGRGSGRVRLRFHADGDVHAYGSGGRRLGRTGSGKVAVKSWAPVTIELTRRELKVFKGNDLVMTADVSREPARKGGVYFYSDGGGTAELKDVRVRPLSR